MEEPTCVIHAFSYTSGISNEAREENPMYALGESISLGRFTSESLSWEKWSTFNRNRYVEEAEKYSRPGSVKQKKAYLEAHFKRMATLKAAASPEQANATQEAPNETNVEEETHDDGTVSTSDHDDLNAQQSNLSSQPDKNGQQCVEKEAEDLGFGADQNEDYLKDEVQSRSSKIVESDQAEEINQTGYPMDAEKQNSITETESGSTKTPKSRSQSCSISQENSAPALIRRNPPFSSYIASVERGQSQISLSSPAKSVAQSPEVHARKEQTCTPNGGKSWMDDPDKKKTPLCTSKLSRLISPVIRKFGGSSKAAKKHKSIPPKTSAKEKLKRFTKLSQIFCCGAKLPSNSLREKERLKVPT